MNLRLQKLGFNLLYELAIAIFIFSLLGYLNKIYFIFDIFCHFRFQYMVFGIFFLAIFVIFEKLPKRNLMIALLLFTVSINLYTVINNRDFIKYKKSTKQNSLSIGYINVFTPNKKYNDVISDIKANDPDVLILEEVNDIWLKTLKPVSSAYPHKAEYPSKDNFGVSIYSKHPLKHTHIEYFSNLFIPAVFSEVNVDGKTVKIIGMHTTPPVNPKYYKARNEMLSEISKIVKSSNTPVIAIGDINTTLYSSAYRSFIKESGLTNASDKTYLTWSCNFPPILRIQIDHAFVTGHFDVEHFRSTNCIGSDHLPIYLNLKF